MIAILHIRNLRRLAASVAFLAAFGTGTVAADGEEVVMYKDPNCGCCGKWAEHMRDNGFSVKEISTSEMSLVKSEAGVPRALGSCHTATVDGYVVEGHVPASDVKRLLAERPAVVGISAPGMPLGSPGMEGPYEAERYDVVSFDKGGKVEVFASH
ncbi:MAG TPA: DUF411 domain-containing protein [Rhodocyclaceae bacterium]|nr:DUF411 domain-containing protein [Rhodocyclaceae bacterium]